MGTRVITKRMREQAALICAVTASSRRVDRYASAKIFLGVSEAPFMLALEVARHVRDRLRAPSVWTKPIAAEAEALLRTGFVPRGWRGA